MLLQTCVLSRFSHVQLFATLWTVAHQAPLSVYFSRREYWSGLPFPSPGDLPNPGIEARSPMLQADSLPSEPPGKAYAFRHLDFSFPVLSDEPEKFSGKNFFFQE